MRSPLGVRGAPRTARSRPGWSHERKLWAAGHRLVGGVDEVGRGAWAGPLSVGVAVLCPAPRRIPRGLRDSKQLPEVIREAMFDTVARWCTAWAVGHAAPDECDRMGMTHALRVATRRAFAQLPDDARPDVVVLDGSFDYVSPPLAPPLFEDDGDPVDEGAEGAHLGPVHTVIKADARCASVAAASVLAKVTRDRMMRETSVHYPPFDFERNKGYPSPSHKRALCGYGLSAVHRRSWAFVERLPWELTTWPPRFRDRVPGETVGDDHEFGDDDDGFDPYHDDLDHDDLDHDELDHDDLDNGLVEMELVDDDPGDENLGEGGFGRPGSGVTPDAVAHRA